MSRSPASTLIGLGLALGAFAPPALAADLKAPDFALKDVATGKTVKLSDFRGKVVLVNFWATWCPPCRLEIPDLVKVYDAYKKKGLVVLGVSLDDDPVKVVPGFIKDFKTAQKVTISYPMLVGDEKTSDAYGGIRGIPTTYLVDRKGIIRNKYIGPPGRSNEEIQAAFKGAVAKLL